MSQNLVRHNCKCGRQLPAKAKPFELCVWCKSGIANKIKGALQKFINDNKAKQAEAEQILENGYALPKKHFGHE